MKMTRNRKLSQAGIGMLRGKSRKSKGLWALRQHIPALAAPWTRAGLGGAALVALLAAGAPLPGWAQEESGRGVTIELNKLEPNESACRAYLVVKDESGHSFDSLKLDLVMFDGSGVVAKRLAVQAAPLPEGKTSLKVFDIEGHDCPSIGSILLNDVLACEPAPEAVGNCLALIDVSARGAVSFIK